VVRPAGREGITALKRRAVGAEEKLSRLYRAIEDGLADLEDPNFKGRIMKLKRIRDSAKADVERAENRNEKAAQLTMEAINEFARTARERREDGTFRRSHVQKFVQRAEVGANQIVIRGSALKLLQTSPRCLKESLE
jgi:site-specific DNA recombinase